MNIPYRAGYPQKKALREALEEILPNNDIVITDTYKWLGAIHWQRSYINEHIPKIIEELASRGVEVEKFRLYNSPSTGEIKFKKKQ